MLISETAPLKQNGTLKFASPCAYMTAVHLWLHESFAAVEKENGRFSSTKSNCLVCCFEKAKTSVAIKGRYKVIPRATLICTKAAAIRPAISYFKMFKSSSLKRGMDASDSPFFCVVRHGRSILSWWIVVFQLKSNSWNIYIHSPRDWWWDISTRHSNAKSCNHLRRRLHNIQRLEACLEYQLPLFVPALRKCARL